jgi:hypothetical protein
LANGLIGFRGFLPLQQQINRKSPQQGNNKHHRNKKLTITKNQQNTTTTNQQIHQYWTEPAKVKLMPWQNRRDLPKFDKISPDLVRSHLIWNLYVAVRDLEVEIDGVAVEIGRCGSGD